MCNLVQMLVQEQTPDIRPWRVAMEAFCQFCKTNADRLLKILKITVVEIKVNLMYVLVYFDSKH